MNERLIAAARAVVQRWHSTDWKAAPTADFIKELGDAADALAAQPARAGGDAPSLVTIGAMHQCRHTDKVDVCVHCGAMAEELSKPCKAWLKLADEALAAALAAAPQPAASTVPAGYVSAEQLAAHQDPEGDEPFGRYLPVRKTPAGKFTQPIYTAAPAAVERDALDTARMDWLEKHGSDVNAMHETADGLVSFHWDCELGEPLRSEIDAAMAAHGIGSSKEGGAA